MKNLLRVLALLWATQPAFSQCLPEILNCPASAQNICDLTPNDPLLWNAAAWLDPATNLHDLADAPAELNLLVKDPCGDAHIRYRLQLDLDADGAPETLIDSDNLPPANTVYFNNDGADSLSGGLPRSFDERPVLPAAKWRFALKTVVSGDSIAASVQWDSEAKPGVYTLPELPMGKHKITWIVSRNGEEKSCTYVFTIKDCKKPTVVCINNLSVNIMPTKMIQLWASDFLQYKEDNYTPADKTRIGIRRAGTGTGFPFENDGVTPRASVVFLCDDLGLQSVELWAIDLAGNADFCETSILVQDNIAGVCEPLTTEQLCIRNACNNAPIEDVGIKVENNSPFPPVIFTPLPFIPDMSGCANMGWNPSLLSGYTIRPTRDSDPLNGLSTFDLIQINKHILGLETFNTNWKFIAADVNGSRSVTTYDIVELRKLILGVYTDLPNVESWRFYPEDFVFSTPSPFGTPIPNSRLLDGKNFPLKFFGVKVGDLNCTSLFSIPKEDRAPAAVEVPDQMLRAGQTVELPLRLSADAEWLGFQFGLSFDTELLEIEDVLPGNVPGLDEQSLARPRPGALAVSWFDAAPRRLPAGETLLRVRVRALTDLRLADALRLETARLEAEAYLPENNPAAETTEHTQGIVLRFAGPAPGHAGETNILEPRPNPTAGGSRLSLQLAAPAPVQVEVFDMAGQRLFQRTEFLPEGLHSLEIPAAALPETGLFGWRVQAGEVVRAGKLVRQ